MCIQVQSSLHAAHIHILDESKKFSNVLVAAAMPTFYGLYLSRFEALRNCTAVATEYTRAVPLEFQTSFNLEEHTYYQQLPQNLCWHPVIRVHHHAHRATQTSQNFFSNTSLS